MRYDEIRCRGVAAHKHSITCFDGHVGSGSYGDPDGRQWRALLRDYAVADHRNALPLAKGRATLRPAGAGPIAMPRSLQSTLAAHRSRGLAQSSQRSLAN
jgi:hypothetical protein